MRIELARACAVPERQMRCGFPCRREGSIAWERSSVAKCLGRLILAPFAMSLARENTSRVVDPSGKGKRKGRRRTCQALSFGGRCHIA